MIVNVTNPNTAATLQNAIAGGNCIVLYHMEGCPHCVSMLPEWKSFKQQALKQFSNNLTIGEVEREYIDMVPEAGVNSFPTIKFYRVPEPGQALNNTSTSTAPPATNGQGVMNLLRGMMQNNMSAPPAMNNEIPYENARTANMLIKFARDNLVKGKKAKMTRLGKTLKRQTLAKLSKRSKTKKNPGLVNTLAELMAPSLKEYKASKANDTKTAKKIKRSLASKRK